MSKLTNNKNKNNINNINNQLVVLALAALGAFTGVATAADMTVDSKGGLEVFELDENNYWFKVGGRLFFDQVFFDNPKNSDPSLIDFPSGSRIRAARLSLKGGVGQNWIYKFDIDMHDKAGATKPDFGEAFLGYTGCKDFWFAVGQISIPFGLENWQSSNALPFMEVSLPTAAFAPSKGIGFYGEWHGTMLTAAAALYHPQTAGSQQTGDVLSSPAQNGAGLPIPGTGTNNSAPGSDDLGAGARVTFSPTHDDYTTYHAGISSVYQKLHKNANNLNYVANFEAHARQTPKIFSNIPPNSSKNENVWGLELAGQWGPLLTQGEYFFAKVNRDSFFPANDLRNPAGSLHYNGYYVQAAYVLTGEKRDYDFDSGSFDGVHPLSSKGAWELSLRHSYLNLNDIGALLSNPIFKYIDYVPSNAVSSGGNSFATGYSPTYIVGSAHSTAIGLTWWVNDNVRFLTNYVRTSIAGKSHVDALAFRAQVSW